MSVCTLPTPVSPQLVEWCPRVKVVLFVSETHLILCRQSGQQVWNTKLLAPSPGAAPVSVSWSPDGQFFVLVFSDGSYTVHQALNGRQSTQFRPDPTKVASVGWALTSAADAKPLTDGATRQDQPSVAAVGTVHGTLKISVYGALSIGELPLPTGSNTAVYRVCVDDANKEYAAVQDSYLYVYKASHSQESHPVVEQPRLGEVMRWLGYNDKDTITSVRAQKLARQSARAVEMATALVQSCSKFAESLEAAYKQVRAFLHVFSEKSKSPTNVLLEAALYGIVDPVGIEWIHSQHEQGFKRWYKALSQSFDNLRRLLTESIVLPMEELLTVVDDLHDPQSSGFADLTQAHALAYKLIGDTVKGSQKFELQACFMEYLFREETDRPIAVTKVTKVALSEVIESLVSSDAETPELRSDADGRQLDEEPLPGSDMLLLGLPNTEASRRLEELMSHTQSDLNDAVQKTCDSLRAQMQLSFRADVGERVRAIRRQADTGGYTLILESGELAAVDPAGVVSSVDRVVRQGAIFTGRGCDVVSMLPEQKQLELPDGSKKSLAFEPAAIAAHFDGELVTVCALSEDCQHYQFVTI